MNSEELEVNESGLDLVEVIRGALRSAMHLLHTGIALIVVGALVMCLYGRLTYKPVYQASASFSVRVTNPLYATQQYYNISAAEQMAKTFPSILTSGILSQQVQQTLGISYMPAVSASVLGSTNIFTMTVTSSDAQLAYDVLQCVVEHYPDVAEFVVGPTVLTIMDETGVPTRPVNAISDTRNAVKGAVFGAAIWMALAVLYWLTHQTVDDEKTLRKLVNLPCLGILPMAAVHTRKKKKNAAYPKVSEENDKYGFSESIRLLRVRVEKLMTKQNAKVLMVTSTIANEGKTTVAMNLATALAQKGKKTLLVDCDLRNPSVASALDAQRQAGFSDFLQGKEKINDLLQKNENPYLYVIYGGEPVRHPEQLLSSEATHTFITAARNTFDYVILDTPPCSMMADASEVSTLADCTLLTVRQNFACRSQIVEGIQLLGDGGKPILGCVLNMTTPKLGKKDYSYSYYGYYGK